MVARLLPFALAALLGIVIFYGQLWIQTDLSRSDFRVFYTSGRLVRNSPALLYDLEAQRSLQSTLFPAKGSMPMDLTLSFVNPPYVALLYSPFTLQPPKNAFYLYGTFSILLFGIAILRLQKLFGHRWSKNRQFAFILFALSFAPFFVTLAMGQTSILSLLLVTFIIQSFIEKKEWIAGILLGSLVFKPQFLVAWTAVLPITLNKSKGILVGSALFVLASLLLLGNRSSHFIQAFIAYAGSSGTEHSQSAMISWQGLITQINVVLRSHFPVFGIAMLLSITTLIIGHLVVQKKKLTILKTFAFLTPLVLLASLHVHVHDALLLLIPIAYLWSSPSWKVRFLLIWVWICFFLAYFSPFYPYPFFFFPHLTLLVLSLACYWQKDRI